VIRRTLAGYDALQLRMSLHTVYTNCNGSV